MGMEIGDWKRGMGTNGDRKGGREEKRKGAGGTGKEKQ